MINKIKVLTFCDSCFFQEGEDEEDGGEEEEADEEG